MIGTSPEDDKAGFSCDSPSSSEDSTRTLLPSARREFFPLVASRAAERVRDFLGGRSWEGGEEWVAVREEEGGVGEWVRALGSLRDRAGSWFRGGEEVGVGERGDARAFRFGLTAISSSSEEVEEEGGDGRR